MLQGQIHREAAKRHIRSIREVRDIRKVACDQMGVGYGPVECPTRPYRDKGGQIVTPRPTDLVKTAKAVNGCLVFTTVSATWEMLDNREAVIRRA